MLRLNSLESVWEGEKLQQTQTYWFGVGEGGKAIPPRLRITSLEKVNEGTPMLRLNSLESVREGEKLQQTQTYCFGVGEGGRAFHTNLDLLDQSYRGRI